MRFIYKLTFLAMGAALMAPMFIIGPSGKPLMTPKDWLPDVEGIKDQVKKVGDLASPANSFNDDEGTGDDKGPGRNFYKWQDERGVWQYSDKPNPNGMSKIIHVNPDANVLASGKPLETVEEVKKSTKKGFSIGMPSPTTVTPGDIPKLMDDVNNVQNLMNGREGDLNKQIDAIK